MPTQPIEDSMDLRLDTQWSRFVYCDEPVDDDRWLSSHAPYRAVRVRRGVVLRTLVLAVLESAREFARDALARHRRRRQMRAIYDTLQGLDDSTLRDLGFHRSEIMSVAAEAVEEAERTRVRVLRMPRAPRW